jgi:hypothetical protein
MTLRRLFLASGLTAWVVLILACGGGGPNSDPKVEAATSPAGRADAEVRRLFEQRLRENKEQHAQAVARYQADLERYNKAVEDYERSVAEYPAKVKDYEAESLLYSADAALASARRVCDLFRLAIVDAGAARNSAEVGRLTDLVNARYTEVIQKFPNTPAEADARALRRGDNPPPRPLPVKPVAPTNSAAPTKPTPPAPPISPEVLLATVKREYEEAVAKAAEERRRHQEAAGTAEFATDVSADAREHHMSGDTYVGPRGGRYHYSANGNKVYERRRR